MKGFDDMPGGSNAVRGLDRLVDGELNDDEQRQLLVLLEAQPDGWRRCALAFIEAQTWQREMRGLVQSTAVDPQVDEKLTTAGGTRSRKSARGGLRWLAIAAGLMLTFVLGATSRNLWPVAAEPSERQLATSSAPDEGSVAPIARQSLKVMLPTGDGTEQSIEVPVVEANEQQMQSLLAEQQPVLSELELKTLESTGHQVAQHRAYYPVQLEDGRQAVVPMDVVEVRYTGGWQ